MKEFQFSGRRARRFASRSAIVAVMLAAAAALGGGAGAQGPVAPAELVAPGIEVSGENVDLVVRQSVSGRRYQVQSSDSTIEGTWMNVGTERVGDGGTLAISTPYDQVAPRRFYRLVLDAPPASPEGFVLIPAGTFQMGDSFGEGGYGEDVHPVNVSAFFLQAKETTKAEWDEVHAWAVANGYGFDIPGSGKGADHPVHTVNWYDVVKWCNARSEKEALEPCYYTDEGQSAIYRTGQVDVAMAMVKWAATGYRLPTEAEWEKAARGGLEGRRFPWGDTMSHSQANFWDGGGESYATRTAAFHPDWEDGDPPYTSSVGSFAPNGYGLYDMSGNVWEWCWDWYKGEYYAESPVADPRGSDTGSYRVFRGGSWISFAWRCRVALRNGYGPELRRNLLGFRPARGQ